MDGIVPGGGPVKAESRIPRSEMPSRQSLARAEASSYSLGMAGKTAKGRKPTEGIAINTCHWRAWKGEHGIPIG